MTSRAEDNNKRRELTNVWNCGGVLEETADAWKSDKSLADFSGFIIALKSFVESNGYRFAKEFNGTPPIVSRFVREKDEAWRKRVFDALDKGFTEGQWGDFAGLGIIQDDPRKAHITISREDALGLDATVRSWNEVYKGRSHQLLWKHITNHYMKGEGSELYANMCAIVQSSGMGKSRTVDELGKSHFLIPMNLRDGNRGYPPADMQVREYLTEDLKFADQARGRCFLFLIGLFSQTLQELQRASTEGHAATRAEMVEWFHRQMSPSEQNKFRARFFQGVINIASQYGNASISKNDTEPGKENQRVEQQAAQSPEAERKRQTRCTAAQGKPNANTAKSRQITVNKTRFSMRLAAAKAQQGWETVTGGNGLTGKNTVVEDTAVGGGSAADGRSAGTGKSLNSKLVKSAQDLVYFLCSAHAGANQNQVEVILAFDEAHVLCNTVRYDPASEGQPWSVFIMLREALWCLYTVPVWSLFLSTTGKLSQFQPHHGIDHSMRIRDEKYKAVPAFTTLRYDLFAPRIKRMKDGSLRYSESWNDAASPPRKKARVASKGRSLTLTDITKTDFIVRFGRPLFYLMWRHGDQPVRDRIVRFAMSKLICGNPSDLTTVWKFGVPVNVAFACLSQRLCIEFSSSKYNTDKETQIASHMRLCLKINSDNQFIISSSGSEPLLAEAAATIMQMDVFKAAESLKRVVSGFAINKGDRGELVALLAMTRARDLAIKKKTGGIDQPKRAGVITEGQPVHRAVTVMEFLSQLFSLDSLKKPDLDRLSQDFKDAYIYFNHFIRPFDQSTFTLRFLMQYMTRGAGVLCSTNMPGIDAAFGVVFESEKGVVLREDQMSIAAQQIKNDFHIRRHLHGKRIVQSMGSIVREMFRGIDRPRPVIRIVFSFGSTPELFYSTSTIDLGNGKSVTSHDFWCGGIGDFLLPADNESKTSWEALLSSTMKSKELFEERDPKFKEFAEERVYLSPGGSQKHSFWQWIEESNDDVAESEAEEDRKEGLESKDSSFTSVRQLSKVENVGKATNQKESPTPSIPAGSKRKRSKI